MKTLSRYVRLRYAPGASQVAYKTSADVASKTVTLVVTVAAARALPADEFGLLALAMTTGWLLGVASDAGLPMFLATRTARASAAGTPSYPIARAVMRWRLGLGGVATAAGLVIALALFPPAFVLPFALVVLHQLLGAAIDTTAHAFRGIGRTDIESSLTLAHRGAVALGALTVLAISPWLLPLAVALVVPPLIALVAAQSIARRVMDEGPPVALTRSEMLRDVAPLGMGVLLSALYFRCDVYFLERLHGIEEVGLYNAAFRIVDALRLFPAAALAVAYPVLCAASDRRPVRNLSAALLAASALVAGAIFFGAPGLLALVYGDAFADAGSALRVLALCVPFFYVNYALTHQLIAWDRSRIYLAITASALVANVAGNALLIPTGGMVGAAASTLLTEMVVLAGGILGLVRR